MIFSKSFFSLYFIAIFLLLFASSCTKPSLQKESFSEVKHNEQFQDASNTKENLIFHEQKQKQDSSLIEQINEQSSQEQSSQEQSVIDSTPKDSIIVKDKNNPPPTKSPIIQGCKIFPANNAWNTDISKSPIDPNSRALIASIGANTSLHPDFGTMWQGVPNGIPYIVVPANQKKVKITFTYNDESDPSPYPIPKNAPIEGGKNAQGDRHVLVLQKGPCRLFELYNAFPQNDGSWKADSGAIFDLNNNKLRPEKWTSADAAGLPILPGLLRYEEVQSGEIKHALRFTVSRSRQAYVHPATHWASSRTSPNLPPMGMRVRLKANYSITSFPKTIQIILKAMKKYGMFVADNGSNWFVSGAPNQKWNDDTLRLLKRLKGKDFEVVKMGKIYTP